MIEVKVVDEAYKEAWDGFVSANSNGHILQSWEWGSFRQVWGTPPIRIAVFDEDQIKAVCSFTLHKVPYTSFNIGYCGKGPVFENPKYLEPLFDKVRQVAKDNHCTYIKFEPNIEASGWSGPKGARLQEARSKSFADKRGQEDIKQDPLAEEFFNKNLTCSKKTIFAPQTLEIDLTQTETDLIANFHPKWRYNIRLAERKGVRVHVGEVEGEIEEFIKLQRQTADRDKFFIHPDSYYRKLWEIFHPLGLAHILTAKVDDNVAASWFLFSFGDYLYYAYGASNYEYRSYMPSHALMWSAIQFGQSQGLRVLDLWGAQAIKLPSSPARNETGTSVSQTGVEWSKLTYEERIKQLDPNDPWSGFTRFKEGFNPTRKVFIGAYDLVLNKTLYHSLGIADKLRWIFLRSLKR